MQKPKDKTMFKTFSKLMKWLIIDLQKSAIRLKKLEYLKERNLDGKRKSKILLLCTTIR